MDNSIELVIECDKAARNLVEQAKREAEEITESAKAEKEKLLCESKSRLKAETEARFEEIRKNSDDEISGYERYADEKCSFLDKIVKDEKEGWKKDIVGRITALKD